MYGKDFTGAKFGSVKHSTTTVIRDPFAQIAAAYTKGFVNVRYIGEGASTDMLSTINLPQNLVQADDETLENAWGFLNHEMGHIEVQRVIELQTKSEVPKQRLTNCSAEIFELIPDKVKACGFTPWQTAITPFELLNVESKRLAEIFVRAYPGARRSQVQRQFREMFNITEDPRMELQVGTRWAGAKEHLANMNDFMVEMWTERAKALLADGKDGTFWQLGVAIIFTLHGYDVSFMGPRIQLMMLGVQDIVETYAANWETEQSLGVFDAWNTAVALVARLYEISEGAPPPVPEPDDGEADGEGEEGDSEDTEDAEGESEGEGSDEGDEDADGASGDEGDGDSDDGSGGKLQASNKGKLQVGDIIRVKKTNGFARVAKVFKDGSVEATPLKRKRKGGA